MPDDATAGRRLWLVRHGESTWNALRLVQGQVAAPVLTAAGRVQAEAVGERLRRVPARSLWCSDLPRAVETARALSRALGLVPVLDARLRERSYGVAEGGPTSALDPGVTGIANGAVSDATAAPAGGESVGQLYRRAAAFVEDALLGTGGGDVVVVCHGGVVRVLCAWLDGIPAQRMPWGPVPNGAIVSRPLPVPGRPRPAPGRPELVSP